MRTALIDAERWFPILGYEGHYEVSNLGRVKSLGRKELMTGRHVNPYYRQRKERILKCQTNKLGYVQAALHKPGCISKLVLVHRVTALAHLGLPPEGMSEVNHIDGVKSNNFVRNLEWSNRQLNSLHSTQVLKKNRGEDNRTSVLTEDQVLNIKDRLVKGEGQTFISKLFGVTNHAIYRIQHGYNWAWLTGFGKESKL